MASRTPARQPKAGGFRNSRPHHQAPGKGRAPHPSHSSPGRERRAPGENQDRRSQSDNNLSDDRDTPNGQSQAPRAFSWYPGHMAKALRLLEQSLDLADIILLVMDARIPQSSRQPEIEAMLRRKNKEMLLVLNKCDLAEERHTKAWIKYLRSQGFAAVTMRATAGRGAGSLEEHIVRLRARVQEKRRAKGLLPRDPRLAVVGIPNVGKSSLLNRLCGANRAKTGARPGVTRGSQWVAVPDKWQVLDSPGILYPRIEGETALTCLAACSCVSLDAIPIERVGGMLLNMLARQNKAPQFWKEDGLAEPEIMLNNFAVRRGFLLSTGEADLVRAARLILKSFAQGQIGTGITLEQPPQEKSTAQTESPGASAFFTEPDAPEEEVTP